MTVQPHIRCSEQDASDYAILPGDPKRVERVATFLENTKQIAFNREHKTIHGTYKGIPVLVTSTGMGGASTGIAVEELRKIGVSCMIRIGSCGALQPSIAMGDLLLLTGVVRDEGTSKAYVKSSFPAVPDPDVLFALRYAAKEQGFSHRLGIGRSHDSFYTDEEEAIDTYWSGKGVLGADMESAALFTIASLRGIRAGAILNTVALYGASLENEINNYVEGEQLASQGEEHEIITALEAIVYLEEQKGGQK